MICLTGDLHHQSLGTGNQRHARETEVALAGRYLELLAEARVKVTFFVSGLACEQQWAELRPIAESPWVELGGHNYSCFTPTLAHRVSKKLLGSYNGPPWAQRRDCRRTVAALRRRTGRTLTSWRNHMYMHGPHTEEVLASCGIRVCSDGTSADAGGPVWHPAGLWNFPLNVIPDHEHLYHAERTPEWVAAWQRRYRWSDAFGSRSYHVDQWTDLVVEQLRAHAARGATANMIVHPITLYLCDQWRSFRRIIDVLAASETIFMAEAVERAEAARGILPQAEASGRAALHAAAPVRPAASTTWPVASPGTELGA